MALNHCRWHQSGLNIAVGEDVGRINIYDVAEVKACMIFQSANHNCSRRQILRQLSQFSTKIRYDIS